MTDEGRRLFRASLAAGLVGLFGGALAHFSLISAESAAIGFFYYKLFLPQIVFAGATGFVIPLLAEKMSGMAGPALWSPLFAGVVAIVLAMLVLALIYSASVSLIPLGIALVSAILGGVIGMVWVNAS